MAGENPLWRSFVLPEFEHLNVVFFIVDCVEMASIGELDIGAAADFSLGELSNSHVVWMDRVDFDSVEVCDHGVEATWVKGDCLDNIT